MGSSSTNQPKSQGNLNCYMWYESTCNHYWLLCTVFDDVFKQTRGPRAFYRSPDNKQQTLQSDKKTTRMTGSAIYQYVAVNIWSEGRFRQRRSPPSAYFCPSWINPLEYLAETTTRMAAFQVKPFVFEALFESFLPCLGSHPMADLIKSLNTCAGHENFIPTKFHKHPSSGSVVKADYVCSHIYTCISAPLPLPSPK